MRRLFLFLLPPLIMGMANTVTAAMCLSYEPARVSLTGTVQREVFPGRPNYEDISQGDEPEPCWILHLTEPVSVTASPNNDLNPAADNIREIQLVLSKSQYDAYRKYLGKNITVSGSLFHSFTGHHHKELLLRVDTINKAGN